MRKHIRKDGLVKIKDLEGELDLVAEKLVVDMFGGQWDNPTDRI